MQTVVGVVGGQGLCAHGCPLDRHVCSWLSGEMSRGLGPSGNTGTHCLQHLIFLAQSCPWQGPRDKRPRKLFSMGWQVGTRKAAGVLRSVCRIPQEWSWFLATERGANSAHPGRVGVLAEGAGLTLFS